MKQTFRQSMSWLHTWGGLWFTWILFATFLTGTLGVFDDPISHWMRDKGRAGEVPAMSAEERARAVTLAQDYLVRQAPRAEFWSIGLPDEDQPALRVFWRETEASPFQKRNLDPASGSQLKPGSARESEGGHHFVHMHFELHAGTAGIWIVGAATMAMLVTLVSGIVVHKKIFTDFFTFRPGKGQRSWLDGHNVLAVLTLPFLFMITYTGLIIFWATYMPAGIAARYDGDEERYFSALTDGPPPRPRQFVEATVAPLAPLMLRGEAAIARETGFVVVEHPGDRSASVRIFGRFDAEAESDRLVGRSSGTALFDAISGEVIDVQQPNSVRGGTVLAVQQTMNALHFVRFGAYPLKWLYFLSGMAGAAMLAAGAILFMVKRRKNAGNEFGSATAGVYRVVEVLNVAAIGGLLLACIAYFWINRLLPLEVAERATREIQLFFAVWLATLAHAAWRTPHRAWCEQLAASAFLCLALPLLNLLSTGDWLVAALARGDGETAGVELTALAFGLLFVAALRQLWRRAATADARDKPLPDATATATGG
ncbi:PepSY-associated TM helix domain-containing protein [Rhodocyclus tenuis]|uniref:PepSY-associated TM helix domain-containing protein n=1 Tax=Rhodocyclus tenuis TaxID=1066 RepID=UPI001908CABA|nr:PepSY-associated TM helix domain-containing protein [Rhodocyclus tenuis]MBK1680951.1 iron-regulated protein [Rhodocyclus tenuis]